MRPYSGKIRTRSLILFLLSLALMIALDSFYNYKELPRWVLVLVLTLVTGSSLVFTGCVLYDWWAWVCNKIRVRFDLTRNREFRDMRRGPARSTGTS